MTFGNDADEKASFLIMDYAKDIGINFLDTADLYGSGLAEEILGRWLRGKRDQIVLASKVHFPTGDGVNDRGSSRRHIIKAVERSLRRLNTDHLDILYLHHWDEDTALEYTLSGLTTLVKQGKIRHLGVSNFSAWQTVKSIHIATVKGFAPIVCIQPMYSLIKRQAEVDILPMAASEKLAVFPYSPLGAGLLTGKYHRNESGRLHESEMYRKRFEKKQYWDIAESFTKYATTVGISPAALAVAWVASHPMVTAPVIGARDMKQLKDTLQFLDVKLSVEDRAKITALSVDPQES
jgi:aryl-alcohol dehydrogenase-like predicted oxidoreductase